MARFTDNRNVDNVWTGTAKDDDMRGAGGNDIINGGAGNDLILGGDGNDTLNGGAGNDYLRGDHGTDTLTGGTGADHFEFISVNDSNAAFGFDTITDFNPAEGDQIYLGSLVYPGPNLPSPSIYLVQAPTGLQNELTLTLDSHGNTVANFYYADGGTIADMTFYLLGQHTTGAGFADVIG